MKTARMYNKGCDYCACTGWVRNPEFDGMTSKTTTIICPVCNGSKVITVTEITESESPLPELTDREIEDEFPADPKIIATRLKIPDRLFSSELFEVLTRFVEANENKRLGAKWYRSELRKRNDHVTMRDLNNDDNAREERV